MNNILDESSENKFYKELLRAYIDSTHDAIFVLCDEMKFLLCNLAGEEFFGTREIDLIEHNKRVPITDLFSDPETVKLFHLQFPKVLAGDTIIFESLIKQKSFPDKWIEFTLNKVILDDVNMVIAISRDITDRKKLEFAKENHSSYLEKLVDERTKELMVSNEQKDKLFTIIAHDLRAPFNPIMGYAEMMIMSRDKLSINDYQDFAKEIYASSKKTLDFLDMLLDWSRLQLNKMIITKQSYNLLEIVDSAVKIPLDTASKKNIKININIKPTDVYIDKNIIITIIRNLVNNAIKFTPHGGFITISSFNDDNVISISDSGIGMRKEYLTKVLSKNYFLSTKGTNNEDGTGLGLSLCIDLIEKHGGGIRAESVEGKGTTFFLKFTN